MNHAFKLRLKIVRQDSEKEWELGRHCKCRDQLKDVFTCFIDYEKTFVRVDHTALF